jgi:glycosyltransferase involved in cell wall biosynthesis
LARGKSDRLVSKNKSTHIGIDSRDVFAARPRGVGKSLRELIDCFLRIVPGWKVTLYTDRRGNLDFPLPARIKQIDIRGSRFNAWERIRLPVAAAIDRLDLLHCPSQTAPPVTPCPMILTVHDLIPLRMDDGWSSGEVKRFRKALARSVANAGRIIAVSEFTRRDLLSEFQISEDKVDVIPWGVRAKSYQDIPEEEWKTLCQTAGLRSPFFVAFGGDSPRKNVTRILEAMALFARTVSRDVQLAFVGATPGMQKKIEAMTSQWGISKNVVSLGYLPDEIVASLLSKSEAVVYASLYEGFGLPILEAMAVGAPVITSNVTSMPEIAGDAAILIDPHDAAAIAHAMRECYLNDGIKGELRSRGFRRREDFTWERTARETLAVFRQAL